MKYFQTPWIEKPEPHLLWGIAIGMGGGLLFWGTLIWWLVR